MEETYVADQRRDLHSKCLTVGNDNTTGSLDPPLTLLQDIGTAGIRIILTGATGILQGRELVLATHLNASELVKRGHGEDIEDELLQLDAVRLGRLHSLTVLGVNERNLLAGHVVGQLVHPVLDGLEEAEGVVVVDNVSGTELEQLGLLGVLGFAGLLVDLGVLDNVGLAVLLDDQTDRLGSVTLAHNLGSDIDVLVGGETDENGVGHLDQAVVDTEDVNVLDATLAHVFTGSRGHQTLIDSAVSIGSNSNL